MTSIIIAALAVWLALGFFVRWQCALAEIARLTPLAEIGLRRRGAVEKYEKKHRKGASAPQTGLSSLRDEAGKPSSPKASIPSVEGQ